MFKLIILSTLLLLVSAVMQARRIMKRTFADYILCFLVILVYSCKSSPEDFAVKWSRDIKEKIIADASRIPDSTVIDSARYSVTLYKGNKRLKLFFLFPVVDTLTGKWISSDTAVSVLFSADQKFELVNELCPPNEKGFEGLYYSGVGGLGLVEFRFRSGKIKQRGFRYNDKSVGTWSSYDLKGKVIEVIHYGNIDTLNKLRDIEY